MYIKYDEYELLELFGSEPTYTAPEGAGMVMYTAEANNGIGIILNLSYYDKTCRLNLWYHDEGIFEVSLNNVEYLRSENGDCLRIHQKNATTDYLIYFKPNLFIKIE